MKTFFKGVGAFLYSIVQAILINLFIFALMYCLAKLLFCILSLLWWAIIFFGAITSIPYRKLKGYDNTTKIFILPMITLILNAIFFCYQKWTFVTIDTPKSYFITYNVIATILIVIMTLVSIGGMFSDE